MFEPFTAGACTKRRYFDFQTEILKNLIRNREAASKYVLQIVDS